MLLDPSKKSSFQDDIEKFIRKRFVGQNEAVDTIKETLLLYYQKLHVPGKPIGNFLFLGPTGTGKTRLVEVLAEYLFKNPMAVTKIDCAEIQHSHEIAKLVGSPPGYLGHRETHPMLSQKMLNLYHTEACKLSLVLFDEIEKASNALWNLMLGILDKATLTLGDNTRVDFSNCLIFATSNVGSHEMSKMLGPKIGFGGHTEVNDKQLSKTASRAAKRRFTPEFLNRFDGLPVFSALKEEEFRAILDIELQYLQKRLSRDDLRFWLIVTDRLKDHLISEGISTEYGARHLKKVIQRKLVIPFANLKETGQIRPWDAISIDYVDGKVVFAREEGQVEPRSFVAAGSF